MFNTHLPEKVGKNNRNLNLICVLVLKYKKIGEIVHIIWLVITTMKCYLIGY